jgi:hypothetical protein
LDLKVLKVQVELVMFRALKVLQGQVVQVVQKDQVVLATFRALKGQVDHREILGQAGQVALIVQLEVQAVYVDQAVLVEIKDPKED